MLHLDYVSNAEIAARLHIGLRQVSEYIAAEDARRHEGDENVRVIELRRQLATCHRIIAHHLSVMGTPAATGREAQYILMAGERLAKLMGLDAPIRVRGETPLNPPFAGPVNSANITTILRMAIAAAPQ